MNFNSFMQLLALLLISSILQVTVSGRVPTCLSLSCSTPNSSARAPSHRSHTPPAICSQFVVFPNFILILFASRPDDSPSLPFAQPDASVIPARATLYVQLVQSELLADMHRLRAEYRLSSPPAASAAIRQSAGQLAVDARERQHQQHTNDELIVSLPAAAARCRGLGSVNDLQLSDLMEATGDLRVLSAPVTALEFDWSARHPPLNEHRTVDLGSTSNH